jgi:transcription antitermination protein NusB
LGTRRKSREIAIQLLYQLEINEDEIEDALCTFKDMYSPEETYWVFATHLLHGVFQHQKEIDLIIRKTSNHWSLSRMALVDRSIIRSAIFELLYCPDIPAKVTIDEAVEIAKKFSTDKSSAFINGILDKVAHIHAGKKPSP